MVLLEFDIVPWFQYVPSKLNVSDIWSRPDRVSIGNRLARRWSWRPKDPKPVYPDLLAGLHKHPEVAWGDLRTRLYGGNA